MRNPSSSSANQTAAATIVTTTTTTTSTGGAKITPCCSKVGLKRGPWTPEEDELLANYINKEGEGRWRTLPKRAGLLRCGKSCRLRWMNYLRPSVKRGQIAPDEEDLILRLHRLLGNRWSLIAGRIPGRTDNEIKNYWNTHLSKKLISQGIDPRSHKPLLNADTSTSKPSPSSNQPHNNYTTFPAPPASLPNPNPSLEDSPSEESNANNSSPDHAAAAAAAAQRSMVLVNGKAISSAAYGFFGGATYYDDNNSSNTGFLLSSNNNNMNSNLRGGLVHDGEGMGLMVAGSSMSNYVVGNNNSTTTGLSPTSVDEDEDINYCSDDLFSSFLNSLINEDIFAAQNHVQAPNQQTYQKQLQNGNIININSTTPSAADHAAALNTTTLPSSGMQQAAAFGFGGSGWDAPLMSAAESRFQPEYDHRDVCALKEENDVKSFQEKFLRSGPLPFQLTGCGGRLLILTFTDKQTKECALAGGMALQPWFRWLKPWSNECQPGVLRDAWLKCSGLPYQLWNHETLTRVGEIWGEVLPGNHVLRMMAMAFGWVKIRTSALQPISQDVMLLNNRVSCRVYVTEETFFNPEQWAMGCLSGEQPIIFSDGQKQQGVEEPGISSQRSFVSESRMSVGQRGDAGILADSGTLLAVEGSGSKVMDTCYAGMTDERNNEGGFSNLTRGGLATRAIVPFVPSICQNP
ncbi:hypothetical protein Dimus_011632 [Dionaea muscipula]